MATKTFKIGLSNTDKQNMAQDVYERVLALTFAEYDSANTYNKGDFVVYEDTLYQCKQDNTTGAWDSSKWQQATLQDLLNDIEGAVAFVNDKANVDGNYPTMTVGAADNLTPYDEDSGIDQEQPFLLQGTGCGNGEQQVDTGALGLLKEKQGHTVVVNQQLQNPEFESSSDWNSYYFGGTVSIANGVATITNSSSCDISRALSKTIPSGHKVLFIAKVKTNDGNDIRFGGSNNQGSSKPTTTSYTVVCDILSLTSDLTRVYVVCLSTTTCQMDVDYFYCIDLTQWFNGDIPAHLLSHPEDFFRYYQGSLAYNEGELVNANGRYIKCIGMNQWDGTHDVKAIPNREYYIHGSATLTYKDNGGNTISSESKTNEVFTTPANCLSIGVSGSGDISINLYYEDEERCLTYEPYQVLANIDTGTETLRSAGSVKDSKAPDGTITRRIGTYTFTGEEVWSASGSFYTTNVVSSLYKRPANNDIKINAVCDGAEVKKPSDIYDGETGIAFADDGNIRASADICQTLVGKTIYYELAEPTTEQGTPYSKNLVIDDFGSMDFGGTNGVPQGASIFYAVDYKAFIDSLYNTLDGDATDVAKASEITDAALAERGYVKQQDLSSEITDVAGLTYDIKKLNKTGNVIQLDVRAVNETGSEIAAYASLFSLASGLFNPSKAIICCGILNDNFTKVEILNTGIVGVGSAIPVNGKLHIHVSYIV